MTAVLETGALATELTAIARRVMAPGRVSKEARVPQAVRVKARPSCRVKLAARARLTFRARAGDCQALPLIPERASKSFPVLLVPSSSRKLSKKVSDMIVGYFR